MSDLSAPGRSQAAADADRVQVEPVELVLLDVGGPIYDDDCYARALLRAARELSGDIDEAEFRRVYDETRQRQSGGLRQAIAARFVPGADRHALSDLAEKYWEYPVGALYPDVRPALEEMSRHYRLGLVANQRTHVTAALSRDRLLDLFDVLALSELVGVEKPAPGIFQHALSRTGIPASRAVHVGNRLDTDVRAAHRVGLRSVWVLRGEAPPHPTQAQLDEPDAVVDDLRQLPAVMADLTCRVSPRGDR